MPIGLGIYWAWVQRDWAPETRRAAFAAADRGALAGAWLAVNATTALLALITTIVGAAAAANLALLVTDISRGRALTRQAEAPARRRAPRLQRAG